MNSLIPDFSQFSLPGGGYGVNTRFRQGTPPDGPPKSEDWAAPSVPAMWRDITSWLGVKSAIGRGGGRRDAVGMHCMKEKIKEKGEESLPN